MKIEYDKSLYREIANFPINEIVKVENRKRKRSIIHIINITKLSWQELQLLVADGPDRFSKMVLLYRRYANNSAFESIPQKDVPLTSEEVAEINHYIKIFQNQRFSEHTEVNNYITDNDLWGEFQTIRSLNDHGKYKDIEGIQPKYFEVVCGILKISGQGGCPLDSYTRY